MWHHDAIRYNRLLLTFHIQCELSDIFFKLEIRLIWRFWMNKWYSFFILGIKPSKIPYIGNIIEISDVYGMLNNIQL